MMVPWVEYAADKTKLASGSLDPKKFYAAAMYIQKHPTSVSSVKGELDDVYDMATNVIYKKNEKGEIVKLDGTLVNQASYEADVLDNC